MKNRLATIAAALALLATAAEAQTPMVGIPWVPLGFCQLSPATATKLSACSINNVVGIPAGANLVVVRTEGQTVRYRDDGIAPSSGAGQPILTTDPPFVYEGNLAALQFIQASSSATLDATFYKIPAQ
jgi:hypothetical protein